MSPNDKPLIWLAETAKTPPISRPARIEIGYLLRRLQRGEALGLPCSRPMPGIDRGAAELRVTDNVGHAEWRVIYRVDSDAIVVVALFKKKTQATPKQSIELAQDRLRRYDRRAREEEE